MLFVGSFGLGKSPGEVHLPQMGGVVVVVEVVVVVAVASLLSQQVREA